MNLYINTFVYKNNGGFFNFQKSLTSAKAHTDKKCQLTNFCRQTGCWSQSPDLCTASWNAGLPSESPWGRSDLPHSIPCRVWSCALWSGKASLLPALLVGSSVPLWPQPPSRSAKVRAAGRMTHTQLGAVHWADWSLMTTVIFQTQLPRPVCSSLAETLGRKENPK